MKHLITPERTVSAFAAISCLLFAVSPHAPGRTFTNKKGKSIEADILQVEGNRVQFRLEKNRKTAWVLIPKLSEPDIAYIRKWAEEQKQPKKKDAAPSGKESKQSLRGSAKTLKERFNLEDNFDAPWPKTVSVDLGFEIKTVKEDREARKYIYHSPHYEFISDVPLSKGLTKKFSVLFEATRQFCKELPISTIKAHVPGHVAKHKIFLFESYEAYVENGGPPGSAGVYIGGKQIVLVPLTSLGVKKVGSSYMYNYKGSNKTLPHELVHQVTDNAYYASGACGWFSEGLAEYVAVTPYRSGKFMARNNLRAIKKYVTEYGKKGRGGRALGKEFHAQDLEKYMLQGYSSFLKNANTNYGLGLLITYYFFHMDDKDRTRITAFLKALKEGKHGKDALKLLLDGRSFDELEKQITRSWRSRGVRIHFN